MPTVDLLHERIARDLLFLFERRKDQLLLTAATDGTRRRVVPVYISENYAAHVYYNKKLRRFTHVGYTDIRGHLVEFSMDANFTCSTYLHPAIRKTFPFGWSKIKMTNFLITH